MAYKFIDTFEWWNKFKKYWVPVFLYAGFIFYISSMSAPGVEIRMDLSLIHIPEFFILSYLIFRALSGEKISPWYIFILAILISTFYGIADEIHQLFVPGRYFSIFDMIFNFIGSSLILFKVWKKIVHLKEQRKEDIRQEVKILNSIWG